ncbi:MAG: metallophosphoesterase [Kiritimatiellae bacterium]|nr:metallophosphoesterase [Kiritimatiellia bacterium]
MILIVLVQEQRWLRLMNLVVGACVFVIHCGDMCQNPSELKDYIDYYNDFGLPTYHVLGNHETDGCSYEDVLKTYRMDSGHYFFDCNGFRFIVVDNNYFYRKASSKG